MDEEKKDNKNFKLFLYVALTAGAIFVIWLITLPYTLPKTANEEVKNEHFEKVADEAGEVLNETEEILKILNDKIEKLKETATST